MRKKGRSGLCQLSNQAWAELSTAVNCTTLHYWISYVCYTALSAQQCNAQCTAQNTALIHCTTLHFNELLNWTSLVCYTALSAQHCTAQHRTIGQVWSFTLHSVHNTALWTAQCKHYTNTMLNTVLVHCTALHFTELLNWTR